MELKKIGVAGAGAMGLGIAQVFAAAGFEVVLFDVSNEQLEKAKNAVTKNFEGAVAKNKMTEADKSKALSLITFSTELNALKADVVIEAIVEKLEAKTELFQKLATINSNETILATNTSSIPVTRIAKDIPHPSRIAGMHFFNPAHIMKLVEIISGVETAETTAQTLKGLALQLGKTPVMCNDSAGFIVNRVARHYYVESLKLLEEKIAPIETVDALMESAGFKMGPFKLMDMVGNDINFAVTSSLFESFHKEARFRPSRIQQQKVEAGHLGIKSGKGFYNYNAKT